MNEDTISSMLEYIAAIDDIFKPPPTDNPPPAPPERPSEEDAEEYAQRLRTLANELDFIHDSLRASQEAFRSGQGRKGILYLLVYLAEAAEQRGNREFFKRWELHLESKLLDTK